MKRFEPIGTISGPCFILARDHIDTDQIIPARFLYRSRKEGFGGLLFHDFLPSSDTSDGELNLDQAHGHCPEPKILIAADNFGCGSSREHAVWALLDNGFKAVIAKSFGDIFYGNAINNGLLVIKMPQNWDVLMSRVSNESPVSIDLPEQTVQVFDSTCIGFEIDEFFKNMLMKGAQEIDMTLSLIDKIKAFELKHSQRSPWLQAPSLKQLDKENVS